MSSRSLTSQDAKCFVHQLVKTVPWAAAPPELMATSTFLNRSLLLSFDFCLVLSGAGSGFFIRGCSLLCWGALSRSSTTLWPCQVKTWPIQFFLEWPPWRRHIIAYPSALLIHLGRLGVVLLVWQFYGQSSVVFLLSCRLSVVWVRRLAFNCFGCSTSWVVVGCVLFMFC